MNPSSTIPNMKSPRICWIVSSSGCRQNLEYHSRPSTRDLGRSTATFIGEESSPNGFNEEPFGEGFPTEGGGVETSRERKFAGIFFGIIALFVAILFLMGSFRDYVQNVPTDLAITFTAVVVGAALLADAFSLRSR